MSAASLCTRNVYVYNKNGTDQQCPQYDFVNERCMHKVNKVQVNRVSSMIL